MSPGTFRFRRFLTARELSIFVDESGSQNGHSAYVIVSLVFHEQDEVLDSYISAMEEDLARKGLPNLPFHASPLMYGKGPYKGLEMDVRKKMLACFEAFCRRAPFSCKSFSYKRSEVEEPSLFTARFKRDLVVFLTDNLEYFQNFDCVKIYYDNGQQMVTAALQCFVKQIFRKPSSNSFGSQHESFSDFTKGCGTYPSFLFPSMSESVTRRLSPLNSTSLPWCTILSTSADASLSSANTVPHFPNSMLVVSTIDWRS